MVVTDLLEGSNPRKFYEQMELQNLNKPNNRGQIKSTKTRS